MVSKAFLLALASAVVVPVLAHGGHDQEPLSADTDWATRHLAEEHHISNFDPGAFFSLHDYDSSLIWTPDEITRTYGLNDESARDTPDEKRREVIQDVLDRFDRDRDGFITKMEFIDAWREGQRLKDFGLGPGHHGDDEYEYEIHHFEKYHDENTREEDLTHPEDIAHFAKHDAMEEAADRQEQLDRMPIVEQNIPQKFRRVP
ncbi:MAG: hypothetical protein HETSPECPRED_002179 [Heterodermia speciosa]|uniref:EF-hand domain-containing protein n=1 Tax=Heterodermia speciosa TaxID=116794 RepID=A0A8H3J3P2_9LECA|nr:MAG: hypothetical protein HETSPECPRED_002179 [Heterodermia speciosa]